MEYLFLIFLLLAVIHFIYEKILLPSILWNLRYELLGLRKELQSLDQQAETQAFHITMASINHWLDNLKNVDIRFIAKLQKEIETDNDLKIKIHQNLLLIQQDKKVYQVFEKVQNIISKALVF